MLYRVLVQADGYPTTRKVWVTNPDDEHELKTNFQWNFGYWPETISVTEILDTIDSSNKVENIDHRQPNFD